MPATAPTPAAEPDAPARVREPDPWAAHVLDHAERVMAGEPVPAAPARPWAPRPDDSRAASAFEALDLGPVPDAVARLVRSRPGIAERDLVPLVATELMLGDLPIDYRRLLGRLVWSARGRRLVDLRGGIWALGPATDGVIPELAGWSLNSLAQLAGEFKDRDTSDEAVFEAVLTELVGPGERAPRIVAICAGAAIALARRRGYLDFDRWGQGSFAFDSDG